MTPEILATKIKSNLTDWSLFCESTGRRNHIPDLCKGAVEVMDDGGVYLGGIVVRIDPELFKQVVTQRSLRGLYKSTIEHETVTIYEVNEHADEFALTRINTTALYEIPAYLNHRREVDAFGDWRHAEQVRQDAEDA